MARWPFARLVGANHVEPQRETQLELPPLLAAYPEGAILYRHVGSVRTGTIDTPTGPRIVLLVGEHGANGGVGSGLVTTPSAEQARELGQSLIDLAAQLEKQAAEDAAAAIEQARKS